jgi:hypothetical protein
VADITESLGVPDVLHAHTQIIEENRWPAFDPAAIKNDVMVGIFARAIASIIIHITDILY